MHVAALYAYPVKSCAGLALEAARLDALGLALDRRFAILSATGTALTQRDCPRMATIRPALDQRSLRLELGELASVEVALDLFEEPATALVWAESVHCRAAPSLPQLDAFLGTRVRLVALGEGARRGFEDAAPLLVTSLAALDLLNARLGEPLGMERFRPNVVLDREAAWSVLHGEEVVLRRLGPCERCEVITIDQARGERRGLEPLLGVNAALSGRFGSYAMVARAGLLRREEQVSAG